MSEPATNPAKPTEPSRPISKPASAPKRRPRVWPWVLLVVVVVGLILFLRHRSQESAAKASTGQTVPMISTATAQEGNIGIYLRCLGNVTPLYMVSVNSRVAGQIMNVHYSEGQLVHAGDPLLDIDPGPNQAALTVAEGQLAHDQALLEDAQLDLERYKEAFASNAIPKQQLDTQTAVVHQDEGTVKVDQGNLDNARVQLAYTHITAPISGRVGLRLVDPGNIVPANGSNLVVIAQLQPISVIFTVAEDDLPQVQKQLRQGKKLMADVFDRTQTTKLATGTVETLDNEIDPSTGMIKLRAVFTNADESLFPNQFVNVRLLVDTLTNVTLLPNPVIQRNAESAYVYLYQPGPTNTVAVQNITVGTTDGNVSEIEDGVEPGDVVAADNFTRLTEGAQVALRPATNGTSHASSQEKQHPKSSQ
jgi:membrane fusion protein, multidrug efflux system